MNRKKINIFTFFIYFVYIVCAIHFLLKKEFLSIGIIGFCMGINLVLYICNKKLNNLVDNSIYIILNLFIISSSLLGSCFRFYDSIKHYDDFLHLWSGIVSAHIAYLILKYFNKNESIKDINKVFIIIFLFMFTMGTASIWEMIEFSLDKLFGMNTQVGSLNDTMIDIIDAFVGGVISIPYFLGKIENLSH